MGDDFSGFLSALVHVFELVTLTVLYVIPLYSNLFCLIKQTLVKIIYKEIIQNNDSSNLGLYLPHLSLLPFAHLPTADWLGCSPLIASFSQFFDLILPVMQPVLSCHLLLLPQIFFFEKPVLLPSVSGTQMHIHMHTHAHAHSGLTPDSGLIWSSVFTTTVHLELTLQVANILLRDYLRDLCLRYTFFPIWGAHWR